MAKKKKVNNSETLIRKGIALLAAVLTLVFFALDIVAVKMVGSTGLFGGASKTTTEPMSIVSVLLTEDNASLRENLPTATIILWVVSIVVILAVALLVASLLMKKKSNLLAKIGSIALVASLLALFLVSFDKATFSFLGLAESETYVTNITALYFVALGLSGIGLASVIGLKK